MHQLSKGSTYRTEKEKLINKNRELAESNTVCRRRGRGGGGEKKGRGGRGQQR